MILQAEEFIWRFSPHIMPKRFTRIRTYGYLAIRNRQKRINAVPKRMKLPQHPEQAVSVPVEVRMLELFGVDMRKCPCCGERTLELVTVF